MTCLESGLDVESAPGGEVVGQVTEVIRNANCGNSPKVDGSADYSRKRRAFCHLSEFSNAKGTQIAAIRTHSVALA